MYLVQVACFAAVELVADGINWDSRQTALPEKGRSTPTHRSGSFPFQAIPELLHLPHTGDVKSM